MGRSISRVALVVSYSCVLVGSLSLLQRRRFLRSSINVSCGLRSLTTHYNSTTIKVPSVRGLYKCNITSNIISTKYVLTQGLGIICLPMMKRANTNRVMNVRTCARVIENMKHRIRQGLGMSGEHNLLLVHIDIRSKYPDHATI